MKKSLFTLCTLLTLLITACNKQRHCCVLPKPPIAILASKNGVDWKAPSQINYKTGTPSDTLNLSGHTGEENINFILKKTGENTYSLIDATYFTTIGQDAIVSSYSLDNSQSNTFTVMVSNGGKTFEGTFSVYLKQTYGNAPSASPATLTFKNGFYKAILAVK